MPGRLTDALVREGLVTRQAADEAIDRHVLMGGALDSCILELQLVDEPALLRALAAVYDADVFDPKLIAETLDSRATRAFPEQWAKKHVLAPIDMTPDGLRVLSPAPADRDALRRLGELLEVELHPVLAPEFRVRQRLRALYGTRLPERYQALLDRYGEIPTGGSRPPALAAELAVEAGGNSGPVWPSVRTFSSARPPPTADLKAPNFSLPLDTAIRMLDDAENGAEIAKTTIAYASQWLRFVALLRLEGSTVRGWLGSGPEADRVPAVRFALQDESTFRVVVETREHYVGPLPSDQLQSQFLAQLGRPAPRMVLLIPLRLHSRTVGLLYGDNAEGAVSARLASDLIQFAERVQRALQAEAMITTEPADSGRPIPLIADAPSEPPFDDQDGQTAELAFVPPEVGTRPEPKTTRDRAAAASIRTDNAAALPEFEDGRFDAMDFQSDAVVIEEDSKPNLEAEGWTPADADGWDDWMPELPPPPLPQDPPPIAVTGAFQEDATVPDLSAEAWMRAASDVVRARVISTDVLQRSELPEPESGLDQPVPLTRVAGARPSTDRDELPLPILIATDDEELLALDEIAEDPETGPDEAGQSRDHEVAEALEHLVSFDADRRIAACATLSRIGPAVVPMVMDRFPGVLNVDPFSASVHLPAFAECGSLLALLEQNGREAHRYVVDQVDAPDPLHRFFAIYFYAAVYVPEAMPKLIQRLHDEEPRICMLAARTLFSYRDHRDFPLVLEHLHGRLSATSLAARRHAAYLIGLFRDVTAIPDLVAILARRDRNMQDVVEDALAEITKQRLGTSAKRWKNWWSKNKDRSRIEWLLDGLNAKDPEIRKSASDELTAVTGMDLGFDGHAPRRQREEARQRWLKWWKAQQAKRAVSLA